MIVLYATTRHGDGYSEIIGQYESWDEIRVRTGMFANDIVLTFHVEDKEKKE